MNFPRETKNCKRIERYLRINGGLNSTKSKMLYVNNFKKLPVFKKIEENLRNNSEVKNKTYVKL